MRERGYSEGSSVNAKGVDAYTPVLELTLSRRNVSTSRINAPTLRTRDNDNLYDPRRSRLFEVDLSEDVIAGLYGWLQGRYPEGSVAEKQVPPVVEI